MGEEDCLLRATHQAAQQRAPILPNATTLDKDGFIPLRRAAWLPDNCEECKINPVTIAYARAAGHREVDATWGMLAKELLWIEMKQDTENVVAHFLIFVMSLAGGEL